MAAKYTPEGEGFAKENWILKFDVMQSICTDFSEAVLEVIVRSSSNESRIFRLNLDRQVDAWMLLSVNINRQRSSVISVKEKLLWPAHACAHSSAILSSQETKSWECAQSGTAWIRVSRWKIWVRNVVGFWTVLHDSEIMGV